MIVFLVISIIISDFFAETPEIYFFVKKVIVKKILSRLGVGSLVMKDLEFGFSH